MNVRTHRFPGIIPANTAGLGDPAKYDEVYLKNETKPLIRKMVNAVEQDLEVGGKLRLEFDLG